MFLIMHGILDDVGYLVLSNFLPTTKRYRSLCGPACPGSFHRAVQAMLPDKGWDNDVVDD